MAILQQKTIESYLERIDLKAEGTIKNIRAALTRLDNFIQEKQGLTLDSYMQELNKMQQNQQYETLFDTLQKFVNSLDKGGMTPAAARNYIYSIKGFVRYCGIRITKEDIKDSITFRRNEEQEREPITKQQLQDIINKAKPNRKAYYLVLTSSGMRPQESVQLRKRDFDLSKKRIMIRIPGKYTKTKKTRITFVSKEAEEHLKPILNRINDDDLVFGTHTNPIRAKMNEEETFNRIRDKLGFTERYDSGVHKITLGGCLRSWFITKTNRIDYGLGHALAGHAQYMKRYDRLEIDDKLELYLKAEPSLSVFQDIQDKDTEVKAIYEAFETFKAQTESVIQDYKERVNLQDTALTNISKTLLKAIKENETPDLSKVAKVIIDLNDEIEKKD